MEKFPEIVANLSATCEPGNPIDFIRSTWHFLGLAMWGGIANYAARVKAGIIPHWSIFEMAGDMVISGFVGSMAYILCQEMQMSAYVTGATVGVAGHLGSRSVFIFERIIRDKLAPIEKLKE